MRSKVKKCKLEGCDRLGALSLHLQDFGETDYGHGIGNRLVHGDFCCKTHMLRYLQTVKMPRYSKKRIQRLVGTRPLPLEKKRKKRSSPCS